MSFSPFNWIRDLLGIRKDVIDTEESRLEVQKLQDESLARHLLKTATFEKIKQYDPRIQYLIIKFANDDNHRFFIPLELKYKVIEDIEEYIENRDFNRAAGLTP